MRLSSNLVFLASLLLGLAPLAGCSCSPAAKVEIPEQTVPLPPPGAATTLGTSASDQAAPPAPAKPK